MLDGYLAAYGELLAERQGPSLASHGEVVAAPMAV
jgi:hypothetical protein